MYSWKDERPSLDPVFRGVYVLQVVAALVIWVGFCLIWWKADSSETLWNLLVRSTRELRQRDPRFLWQPLLVLWLLLPSLLLSSVRSMLGLLVQPVSFRRLALALWVVSMLPLAHFYLNYGDTIDRYSPLKEGTIGDGFWLTGGAAAVLGVLLLVENLINEPERVPMRQPAGQPVQDAEALWQGQYLCCPVCGMLNEPNARMCCDCKSLLFHPESGGSS